MKSDDSCLLQLLRFEVINTLFMDPHLLHRAKRKAPDFRRFGPLTLLMRGDANIIGKMLPKTEPEGLVPGPASEGLVPGLMQCQRMTKVDV